MARAGLGERWACVFANDFDQMKADAYILTHALRLLLDKKDQHLLGLPRLLIDDAYREQLLRSCQDPVVRRKRTSSSLNWF